MEQQREESAIERDYIQRISLDVTNGAILLTNQSRRIERAISSAETLLGFLADDNDNFSNSALIDEYIRSGAVGFNESQVAHDTTFLELRDSGRLSIIKDISLREAMTEYYRLVRVMSEMWDGQEFESTTRFARLSGHLPVQYLVGGEEMDDLTVNKIADDIRGNISFYEEEIRYLKARVELIKGRLEVAFMNNSELMKLLQ